MSVNRGGFYATNTNSSNVLRFRDFEPRSYAKMDMDIKASSSKRNPSATSPKLSDKLLADRKSRGFQFHADGKDVSIELEFIVPFVRIPIERSMSVAKSSLRSLFNLNISSILTTGAVVAVGGIFAILLKFLFSPFTVMEFPGYNKNLIYPTDPNTQNIISIVESKLHENNIDLSVCLQKSICDYVRKSSTASAGSMGKVIDGVLSLDSIRNIMTGTAVNYAVDVARSGEDCTDRFFNCKWNPSLAKKAFVNVVSFEPLDDDIALGLDFILPFIKVPLVREVDIYGNEPALININSAALLSTGILAGSSALVSYLFRRFVLIEPMFKSEKLQRSDNDFESDLWSMMQNVKVIYRNSSGEKVDTSLTGLLTTLDETFTQNGINLNDCLQKALCQRLLQQSTTTSDHREYREHYAATSGVEKIIDGLTGMKWIRENVLRHTPLHDIIDNQDGYVSCDVKYSNCRWSMGGENVLSLIGNYIKFT
ncbi:uncharacterized protein [Musca autumnalis]|uniref:uncharacterized protein n=1 Tax=Musca autumnalis TaxID=221902 RepID=UPI003CEB5451